MRLSQTLRSVGGGTFEVGAFGRALLDVGAHRTYLAHLARDAFVCGNGYLSFGTARDEDLRLLRPEHTWMVSRETAVTLENGREVEHAPVLHVTGARQVEGSCGLSVLEPFVLLLLQREIAQPLLDMEQAGHAPAAMPGIRASADLGRRMLAEVAAQARTLLGGPSTLEVDVPVDLYFPGYTDMQPTVEAVTLYDAPGPA